MLEFRITGTKSQWLKMHGKSSEVARPTNRLFLGDYKCGLHKFESIILGGVCKPVTENSENARMDSNLKLEIGFFKGQTTSCTLRKLGSTSL
jgi:hypothetical protein